MQTTTTRWLQLFDDGSADQRDLLGGKGANLAEMTRMGLPVPPGFTITTDACRAAMKDDGALPPGLMDEVRTAIAALEDEMGSGFGDPDDPLLLSVRSGAKFSMPGMMDTVLNLGLTSETMPGLQERTHDSWFTKDARRRLLEQFGHVVLDVSEEAIAAATRPILEANDVGDASELDEDALVELASAYEAAVREETGEPFPDDPWRQLELAIEAVFRSWNGRRAKTYRRLNDIADDLGTAVNVQVMVFGNAGDDSGTGVAFTRDPATGDNEPFGDFLVGAQGEDVVAGIRNTEPLANLADHFPECHTELLDVFAKLEDRYRDMCDIEFTIQHAELFILQTRVGKRTAKAALVMAVDMVDEGLIDQEEAIRRFTPDQLERLLHPAFDATADFDVLTTGLGASPGAACGHVAFTADDAEARAAAGEEIILVRGQTSPEDLHGIAAAEGVLTSRGGLVSHAAVVARGMGKPAVCGAAEVVIDDEGHSFRVGDTVVRDGDLVSIDGTSGEVVAGRVPVVAPQPPEHLDRLLAWADDARTMQVWANADTATDASAARERGATGIGLCRTEHQFMGADRLPLVQRAILADDPDEETSALEQLYTRQHDDFVELLEAMDGLPVTVRLLDPPLHEFLPSLEELLVSEALGELDADGKHVMDTVKTWDEENPMLGIRGVRLGLLRPQLYRMQVRALLDAAVERVRAGGDPRVRIMIPLVVSEAELEAALADVRDVADEVIGASGLTLDYQVGTMVETPRAALRAAGISRLVDFLSFGTNDLTQMTFGFSRDDVEAQLMPLYLDKGLLPDDPFRTLDVDGVGVLVENAVRDARDANADIEAGVCGEHGGDPASIEFFHRVGLDEVSCSPYRVPVARLAGAHAALAVDLANTDR